MLLGFFSASELGKITAISTIHSTSFWIGLDKNVMPSVQRLNQEWVFQHHYNLKKNTTKSTKECLKKKIWSNIGLSKPCFDSYFDFIRDFETGSSCKAAHKGLATKEILHREVVKKSQCQRLERNDRKWPQEIPAFHNTSLQPLLFLLTKGLKMCKYFLFLFQVDHFFGRRGFDKYLTFAYSNMLKLFISMRCTSFSLWLCLFNCVLLQMVTQLKLCWPLQKK